MTNAIQFAVGGLALPPKDQWIGVAERVRGRAVRDLSRRLTGQPEAQFSQLSPEHRSEISLVSGKDAAGRPLTGHPHAHFLLWPDEHGYPARLVVWRREVPFSEDELFALIEASRKPVPSEGGQLYLVPLPPAMPLPRGLVGPASQWESVLPFVPPVARHRFRSGRVREGETPERLAQRLLSDRGFPCAQAIAARVARPVRLHKTLLRRMAANASTPFVRTGYDLMVTFAEPIAGPILIGDSCHFGLGLFRALEGAQS
ncbi:MAG TPA: type I-U CRISPR-associated protein Csb2 [Terriglobia bacterium]|nr:type I-U CRISPR-associated protein Csb2 [Terriglobia bacterium]